MATRSKRSHDDLLAEDSNLIEENGSESERGKIPVRKK